MTHTYLDVRTYMCTVPRVCKTWNSYLSYFISNYHLDLRAFSALNLNTASFFSCISFMKNLQTSTSQVRSITLNLSSLSNQDRAVTALSCFQDVEEMDLGKVERLTSLAFLKEFKHLRSLKMKDACITTIDPLALLPLKELHLDGMETSEGSLNVLQKISIATLSLRGNTIKHFPLLNEESLRTLDLSDMRRPLNRSCLQRITALPLTSLNLSECRWLGDNIVALENNFSLLTLNLSNTRIKDAHLEHIPRNLTCLNISRCYYITDISSLKTLKNLETLDIRGIYYITYHIAFHTKIKILQSTVKLPKPPLPARRVGSSCRLFT